MRWAGRGCRRSVDQSGIADLFVPACDRRAFRNSRCLLETNLPLFPRLLQLPIPLGMDLPLSPGEHVLWRDLAGRAVQADVVVKGLNEVEVTYHGPATLNEHG